MLCTKDTEAPMTPRKRSEQSCLWLRISQNICIATPALSELRDGPEWANLRCFRFCFSACFPLDRSDASLHQPDGMSAINRAHQSLFFFFFAGSTIKWGTSRFWPRMVAFTLQRAGCSKLCWWGIYCSWWLETPWHYSVFVGFLQNKCLPCNISIYLTFVVL